MGLHKAEEQRNTGRQIDCEDTPVVEECVAVRLPHRKWVKLSTQEASPAEESKGSMR